MAPEDISSSSLAQPVIITLSQENERVGRGGMKFIIWTGSFSSTGGRIEGRCHHIITMKLQKQEVLIQTISVSHDDS